MSQSLPPNWTLNEILKLLDKAKQASKDGYFLDILTMRKTNKKQNQDCVFDNFISSHLYRPLDCDEHPRNDHCQHMINYHIQRWNELVVYLKKETIKQT